MSAHSFTPITVLEFTHGRQRTMEMCKNYLRYCQGRESGGPPVAQTAPPATPPRAARGELVCPGAPHRRTGRSRASSPTDESRALWNSPWIGSVASNAPPSLDLSGGWMPASLDDTSTEERKDEGPDPAWITEQNGTAAQPVLLESKALQLTELERRLTQPTCPVDLFNEALAELKNLDPRNPYFCELHRQNLRAEHTNSFGVAMRGQQPSAGSEHLATHLSLVPQGSTVETLIRARGALGYSRNSDGNYSTFAPCCIGCRFSGR